MKAFYKIVSPLQFAALSYALWYSSRHNRTIDMKEHKSNIRTSLCLIMLILEAPVTGLLLKKHISIPSYQVALMFATINMCIMYLFFAHLDKKYDYFTKIYRIFMQKIAIHNENIYNRWWFYLTIFFLYSSFPIVIAIIIHKIHLFYMYQ